MNRFLKSFLCLLLVFAMLPVPVQAQTPELLIMVSPTQVAPGDKIMVSLSAFEQYTADAVELTYNIPEQLELMTEESQWMIEGDSTNSITEEKAVLTLVASAEITDQILNLVFRVKENSESGIYQIPMTLVVKNGNEELRSIELTVETEVETPCSHTLTQVEAKESTCSVAGNNAYYICTLCEKAFQDAEATTETTVEAETLEKLSHEFGESWTADAENHWHKCAACDEAADKAAHDFEWVTDEEPNEEADGIKHEECTVCGYKRNENTPHHVHSMVKTEAVEPTCTAGGNNAYYTCSLCEKVYKDEAGTTETTVEAETLAVADHTGGTATCTAQAVCEVCGKGYGEMASHSYNEAWNADSESHWHKCVNCDAISAKTAHEFEWITDKEATAEETGLKHEECNVCGYKRNEDTVIDIVVHVHTMVKTASKSATCEEAGNIAYWSCEECGGIYADKDGTIETTMEKVMVEATGHAYDDGKVTTEPTETETGVRTFTCENCGGTKTEEIPALGEEDPTDPTDPEDPTDPSEPEDPTEPEEPVTVTRIAGDNRCETAFAAADKLKEVLGLEQFEAIIIASGNNYADALAGSYLAAVKTAPILLHRNGMEDEIADYIAENLSSDGIVYILGGTAAVPEKMETVLDGLDVDRLAGDNRYETNLAILKEGGMEGDHILVATGMDFADCLAASATGLPILMVNSRLNGLTDAQKSFLEENSGKDITIIGGEAAVSADIKKELEGYANVNRLSGERREQTAVKVANAFYPETSAVVIAYSRNFPDALCGGPLAYALGCPLLLVNKNTESYAADYVAGQTLTSGYVLGGTAAISDATVNAVFGN